MNALPSNLEAERKVCSALHLDGHRAYHECLTLDVGPDDFHNASARTYWHGFVGFMGEHPHAEDDAILGFAMMQTGALSAEDYNSLTRLIPTLLELIDAIRELKRLALRRKLIMGAAKVGEIAASAPDDLPGAVSALSRLPVIDAQPQSFAQLADTQAESVRNPQPEHALRFVHWPWPTIERTFKPFAPGELVVLAARPSIGKSSLARQLTLNSAKRDQIVYFASLEVNGPDFFDGLVMQESGRPKADAQEYLAAAARLRSLPIIFDSNSRTLSAIAAGARRCQERRGLDMLVIDYLGLLADCVPQKNQNKAQAVGDAAGACKRLAGELGCVLLLIAQVNRGPVTDSRDPRMSDLRDSGDIEAHADRVLLLHQPEKYSLPNQPEKSQSVHDDIEESPRWFTQLFQEKGRSVGTAATALWLQRTIARFDLIAH